MPNVKRPLSEAACPITRAVDVLGDKWTLLILKNANVGMTRFDEFRSDLGIADNILSTRLSRLVEIGLLVRTPYEGNGRTRNEYKLTQAGADILPVFHTLADWGHRHTTIGGQPATPILFVHSVCGNALDRGEYCPGCKVTVSRDAEAWIRPWRTPVVATLASPVIGESAP